MVSSQHGRVPGKEDTIIDSPGKVLQAIHIIQIHPCISLAMGLVTLLWFASLFCAVEQCEGQNLIGNDSLPIEVIVSVVSTIFSIFLCTHAPFSPRYLSPPLSCGWLCCPGCWWVRHLYWRWSQGLPAWTPVTPSWAPVSLTGRLMELVASPHHFLWSHRRCLLHSPPHPRQHGKVNHTAAF